MVIRFTRLLCYNVDWLKHDLYISNKDGKDMKHSRTCNLLKPQCSGYITLLKTIRVILQR